MRLMLTIRQECRASTAAQAEEIINAYINGGAPCEKYTRGLYYRGVI